MPRTKQSSNSTNEQSVFGECRRHYDLGFDETDRRTTGKNRVGSISFNEVDELFRSYINENDWPYDALLFDPRVFTFIFEKTSRLLAGKLRGRLIPRESGDILGAKINNAILSFQWDKATNGGTMLSKWAIMDLNTRKYGASFSLCKWRYETDQKDKTLFDGPEMKVLNNRDCAHDLTATGIENCNWFQVREYVTLQELENVNDRARTKPIYKNLDKLREVLANEAITSGGDSRAANWTSRNRAIMGLETDPVGKDPVFKTVEIVTEYRRSQWITFAPKHGVVLRDIENPYQNNELPVVMLRYLPIDDDLYGLSEIEPIKSLQKAINALLSQYVDEVNQKLYSPIAIGPGVKQHTLEWGKGARWIMNNPMTDFRLVESRSNAAATFNQTYSVLVAAMMNALGETSLGVSNAQPMQGDKTATEVRAVVQQRNARDNFNQQFLAEAIGRQMMLWYTMNQLLLFSDPKQKTHILRIVGKDAIKFFQEAGLDQMGPNPQQVIEVGQNIDELEQRGINVDMSPEELMQTPQFPVDIGTKGKPQVVPKFGKDGLGDGGTLYVEPDDLKGTFDFIADVESMSLRDTDSLKNARQMAVSLLVTNPNVLQMLQMEGVKPKFKDLFVTWLEDSGFSDAEKYFETVGQGGSNIPVAKPPTSVYPIANGQMNNQLAKPTNTNNENQLPGLNPAV